MPSPGPNRTVTRPPPGPPRPARAPSRARTSWIAWSAAATPRRAGRAGLQILLGPLAVENRPQVPGPLGGREPRGAGRRAISRIGHVAVAVPVGGAAGLDPVPVPSRPGRGLRPDDGIHYPQGTEHVRIGCRELTQ